MKKRVWVAVVSGAVVMGVGILMIPSFMKAFGDSYEEAFARNFRAGFMGGCLDGDSSPAQRVLCECIADRALEELTIEEFQNEAYAKAYFFKKIIPVCRAEAS